MFIGGGVGTGARAFLTVLVPVPLVATFGVNIAGAYALGFVLPRLRLSGRSRVVSVSLLGVGFLGAFTTFSTFAVEVWARPPLVALAYIAATVAAGVVAGAAGLRVGRRR